MILRYGKMWSAWDEADLFLVTSNSCTTVRDGSLVMGKGTALQAKEKFPGVEKALGKAVAQEPVKRETPTYYVHWPHYLIVSDHWQEGRKLGLFQTKEDWRDWSDLTIIDTAAEMLNEWVSRARELLGRDPVVVLPFPGIGVGRLSAADVLPHIKDLPDCVQVWQLHEPMPDIALPEGWGWVAQITENDIKSGAIDDIMATGASKAFEKLYGADLASDMSGRLLQMLVVQAYATSKIPDKSKRMGSAHHVGQNEHRRLTGGAN